MVHRTDGILYGTTYFGGLENCCPALWCGTIFTVSAGLTPFVETVPRSGRIGKSVVILGTNLKGTTSVTFSGTAASFTVFGSGNAISTTVPAGAATGPVQVVTPSGKLTSNVNFQVLP